MSVALKTKSRPSFGVVVVGAAVAANADTATYEVQEALHTHTETIGRRGERAEQRAAQNDIYLLTSAKWLWWLYRRRAWYIYILI